MGATSDVGYRVAVYHHQMSPNAKDMKEDSTHSCQYAMKLGFANVVSYSSYFQYVSPPDLRSRGEFAEHEGNEHSEEWDDCLLRGYVGR